MEEKEEVFDLNGRITDLYLLILMPPNVTIIIIILRNTGYDLFFLRFTQYFRASDNHRPDLNRGLIKSQFFFQFNQLFPNQLIFDSIDRFE